jgi:hypothetical protein
MGKLKCIDGILLSSHKAYKWYDIFKLETHSFTAQHFIFVNTLFTIFQNILFLYIYLCIRNQEVICSFVLLLTFFKCHRICNKYTIIQSKQNRKCFLSRKMYLIWNYASRSCCELCYKQDRYPCYTDLKDTWNRS